MNSPSISSKSGWWEGLDSIRDVLLKPVARHAAEYHDAVVEALRSDGWEVHREVHVSDKRGMNGRIDLVAYKGGRAIALELDNRRPRKKSLLKLSLLPEWYAKAVLLRDPK